MEIKNKTKKFLTSHLNGCAVVATAVVTGLVMRNHYTNTLIDEETMDKVAAMAYDLGRKGIVVTDGVTEMMPKIVRVK